MGAQKIFLSCVTTLILFNFVFFIIGLNDNILSVSGLIAVVSGLGVIAVLASVVPTVEVAPAIRWFMSVMILLTILYSFSFRILTFSVSYGIGLVTHLTNMCSANVDSLAFMPWVFFTVIGLIAFISGVIVMSSYGD